MQLFDRLALIRPWISVHRRFDLLPDWGEFIRLCRKYEEPHRRYHTLTHLRNCMQVIDQHYRGTKDIDFVRMGIFYHDYIYDIGRQDNERLSAEVFVEYARKACIPSQAQFEIRDLILLTASHKVPADAPMLHRIMNDVDMSILAEDPEYYMEYAKQIWQEYSSVGYEAYQTGRLTFLKSVDPADMFYTAPMRNRLDQARSNLDNEREILEYDPWMIMGPKPSPMNV